MASRDPNLLRPELKAIADDIGAEYLAQYPNDPQPFIDQTQRTDAEQDADYAQGRDADGNIVDASKVITWAKAGQSGHTTKPLASAYDIAFKNATGSLNWNSVYFEKYNALMQAKYGKVMNWGGYFPGKKKDEPHFELADWEEYQKQNQTA